MVWWASDWPKFGSQRARVLSVITTSFAPDKRLVLKLNASDGYWAHTTAAAAWCVFYLVSLNSSKHTHTHNRQTHAIASSH